eukprot:scaffold16501_cov72-Phaeocystis_antarctica.AAC.5
MATGPADELRCGPSSRCRSCLCPRSAVAVCASPSQNVSVKVLRRPRVEVRAHSACGMSHTRTRKPRWVPARRGRRSKLARSAGGRRVCSEAGEGNGQDQARRPVHLTNEQLE